MEVTFVRHRERRDRVYVTRGDTTSAAWDFPSYGDMLPHDLCHLVVEDALGIAGGFWGLVARGVEVALIDGQATLVRDGRPLVEQPDTDFSDLIRAEEAVAMVGPVGRQFEQTITRTGPTALGFTGPDGATEEGVAVARARLAELGARWRDLEDGDSITLTYGEDEPPG
jgi:hypothetical protein